MGNTMSDEEVDKFILGYLSQKEWDQTGEYMKTRYRNMTRNYLSGPKDNNCMPLPDFLRKPVKKTIKRSPKPPRIAEESKTESEIPVKDDDDKDKKQVKFAENVPIRRNPKRQVSEINYFEEEEPSDDRYIFCDRCDKEYLDFCSTCGMLKSLKDFPVPVGVEDRAKKTIPRGVLEVRPSNIHGLGVFAVRTLRIGIQMGPYEGNITRVDTTNGYCWKLRDGRLIDAGNESVSNWMRYVNCARNVAEQNVVAFQYRGRLYYRTCKQIDKGQELLVFYGHSFAKNLGIDTKRYFQPHEEEVDGDSFQCQFCEIGLSTADYRDVHEKLCKFRPNRVRVYSKEEGHECRYCKCWLTTEEFLKTHEARCCKNPKNENKKSDNVDGSFQCEHCPKKLTTEYCLKRHNLIHDRENAPTYFCHKCPYKTIRLSNLRRHERTHDDKTKFQCHVCQKGFYQKQPLDSHLLTKHPNYHNFITSKIHYCTCCQYSTVLLSNLKKHIRYKHQEQNDEGHTDRFRSCIQKSNLKKHLFVHSTAKRPHVCLECKKDFIEKARLDSHVLHNHRENKKLMSSITSKIHRCRFCDYETIHVTHLKSHMNHRHDKANADKFYCQKCHYFSIEKSNLKTHLKTHTSQKL